MQAQNTTPLSGSSGFTHGYWCHPQAHVHTPTFRLILVHARNACSAPHADGWNLQQDKQIKLLAQLITQGTEKIANQACASITLGVPEGEAGVHKLISFSSRAKKAAAELAQKP